MYFWIKSSLFQAINQRLVSFHHFTRCAILYALQSTLYCCPINKVPRSIAFHKTIVQGICLFDLCPFFFWDHHVDHKLCDKYIVLSNSLLPRSFGHLVPFLALLFLIIALIWRLVCGLSMLLLTMEHALSLLLHLSQSRKQNGCLLLQLTRLVL